MEVTFDQIRAMNLAPLQVVKDRHVRARRATLGEKVTTYAYHPSSSSLFVETHLEVREEGSWVVTQEIATPEGTYHNEYIVVDRKFQNLYEEVGDGTYRPKQNGTKVVYQVTEDLEFPYPTFWGQPGLFILKAGGYLVPEDGEYYGINKYEFEATHSFL